MSKILLDVSPTGVEHYAEVDEQGDTLTLIEHTPDRIESQILDTCAQARSLHHSGKTRNLQFAARIPINTYNMWRQEWYDHVRGGGSMTWGQFEVAKLNSRDFEKLRTGNQRSHRGKKL